MHHSEHNKDKLIPLRKFAVKDVYSSAYLSQLVQRGKLKAKKIGRNYYTSKQWFSEYLEQHAQDIKYEKYREYLMKKTKRSFSSREKIQKNTDISHNQINIWKQIAISVAVVLLFLIIGLGLYISYDKGRIAGVEEQGKEY